MRVIKHYKSDGLVRCAERLPRWTQEWEQEIDAYLSVDTLYFLGVYLSVDTIYVYHTMFLHETTLLVYPASVTYDGTPLSWQCDIGLRLEYDF